MRKFMMLGALVAVVVAALALPALAQTNDLSKGDLEAREEFVDNYFDYLEDFYGNRFEDLEDKFFAAALFEEEDFFGGDDYWGDDYQGDERWDERNDHDWWNDWRHDDDRDNDRDNDEVVPAVSQDFQQRAESGDVNQSFNVSSTGDNSNQCAGIQGVANTGNAQNQIGVIQYGSEADDFDLEDVGSTITVSPSNTTTCEQQVNQAASASGW
jgi:hypothetical protein